MNLRIYSFKKKYGILHESLLSYQVIRHLDVVKEYYKQNGQKEKE